MYLFVWLLITRESSVENLRKGIGVCKKTLGLSITKRSGMCYSTLKVCASGAEQNRIYCAVLLTP